MDLGNPDRRPRLDALAAEYALGTLSSRTRRRLDAVARRDPRVAGALRAWEYRLAGLADAVPAVTPAPRVWQGVQARLGMAADREFTRPRWWASLALWRGLAVAGFALALVVGTVLRAPPGPDAGADVVVVLAGSDARPALIATAARRANVLRVKAVGATAPGPGRQFELWALPPGQPPQSLGVLPTAGVAVLRLAGPAEAALQNVPALAVSLEPPGGSPTGRPTGPVLYTGPVQRMY